MKKITSILVFTLAALCVQAQDHLRREFNQKVFEICATIFVLLSIMVFILVLLKRILEHRLKNRIVDKGIDEQVAVSILKTNTEDSKNTYIKWFALLAGAGIGLTIVNYTQPMGIHSIATMAFCIAFSFLGYYIFLKKSAN